jgi:outer membrane protein assembly factor BamB
VLLVAAALMLIPGCSSSAGESQKDSAAARHEAGDDLGNTRNNASSINSKVASDLRLAWSMPLRTNPEGLHLVGSPVAREGIVYLQDPLSNVIATDQKTGKKLWTSSYEAKSSGPNGLAVADGMVFGATPTEAFALDAKDGKEIWSTPLASNKAEVIAMTPAYHDGRVYFSTTPGGSLSGGVGVLWALDAGTGQKIWHFDTVPRGLWGNPEVNFGGGLYYAPSFDGEGSVYVGVSHPGPIPGTESYPWGSSRLGRNLYSNSIVKLDEKSGAIEWYYQITPHGLCNGYLVSPVLTEAGGRKIVIGAGAFGIVVGLDQETGEPLWRRPVGEHNGHDADGLRTIKGGSGGLDTPLIILPGTYGGVPAPMSVSGETLFVPVANSATRLDSQTETKQVGPQSGEVVALDVRTGEVRWSRRSRSPIYGPTVTTNDLVFAGAVEGALSAFEVDSGKLVWKKKLNPLEGGMTVAGDTLLVRTGLQSGSSGAKLQAFRLSG